MHRVQVFDWSEEVPVKRLDLRGRVREAAGALRARVARKARALRRHAEARADRLLRELGTRLSGERHGCACAGRVTDVNSERNVAVGPCTGALVETMAEVLARSGYTEVRADVPGQRAPELVRGTVRSHRPSLVARGAGRPVLVDVFVPGEGDPEEQLSRWQLFSSAADQIAGEFHVVVPSVIEGVGGREWVRRLSEAVGLEVAKVWEVPADPIAERRS